MGNLSGPSGTLDSVGMGFVFHGMKEKKQRYLYWPE